MWCNIETAWVTSAYTDQLAYGGNRLGYSSQAGIYILVIIEFK